MRDNELSKVKLYTEVQHEYDYVSRWATGYTVSVYLSEPLDETRIYTTLVEVDPETNRTPDGAYVSDSHDATNVVLKRMAKRLEQLLKD
jgi:hypothetical protein